MKRCSKLSIYPRWKSSWRSRNISSNGRCQINRPLMSITKCKSLQKQKKIPQMCVRSYKMSVYERFVELIARVSAFLANMLTQRASTVNWQRKLINKLNWTLVKNDGVIKCTRCPILRVTMSESSGVKLPSQISKCYLNGWMGAPSCWILRKISIRSHSWHPMKKSRACKNI